MKGQITVIFLIVSFLYKTKESFFTCKVGGHKQGYKLPDNAHFLSFVKNRINNMF